MSSVSNNLIQNKKMIIASSFLPMFFSCFTVCVPPYKLIFLIIYLWSERIFNEKIPHFLISILAVPAFIQISSPGSPDSLVRLYSSLNQVFFNILEQFGDSSASKKKNCNRSIFQGKYVVMTIMVTVVKYRNNKIC